MCVLEETRRFILAAIPHIYAKVPHAYTHHALSVCASTCAVSFLRFLVSLQEKRKKKKRTANSRCLWAPLCSIKGKTKLCSPITQHTQQEERDALHTVYDLRGLSGVSADSLQPLTSLSLSLLLFPYLHKSFCYHSKNLYPRAERGAYCRMETFAFNTCEWKTSSATAARAKVKRLTYILHI